MKNFDSRTYSINDFREWNENDQLILDPKFQRRSVWADKAKSFLMDTVITGKPMPKIFIRQKINPTTRKTVREVVDGQQRLRTILSFLEDGFKISKAHNSEHGGKVFSKLPEEVQKSILDYELAADLLLDAPDSEVLDIFARLNTYSVKLNVQELRHAKYFGDFRQTVYRLAIQYTTFWQESKVITNNQLVRMIEAELTSDLLVAMIDGIQSKKAIESYYRKFDDELPGREEHEARFTETMGLIDSVLGRRIPDTPFKRIHMFYSLFCSFYHIKFGMDGLDSAPKIDLVANKAKVMAALEQITETFEKDDEERTVAERAFMEAARRATTDQPQRKARSNYICRLISEAM